VASDIYQALTAGEGDDGDATTSMEQSPAPANARARAEHNKLGHRALAAAAVVTRRALEHGGVAAPAALKPAVGPGSHCSPRRRIPFTSRRIGDIRSQVAPVVQQELTSRNEGSKRVS